MDRFLFAVLLVMLSPVPGWAGDGYVARMAKEHAGDEPVASTAAAALPEQEVEDGENDGFRPSVD